MPHIRLLDGRTIQGDSWEDVEKNWNGWFMNQLIEPDNFRAEIAERAKLWSGVEIATYGTSEDFLHECERAGMIHYLAAREPDSLFRHLAHVVPAARLVYLNKLAEKKEAKYAVNG